MSRPSCETFTLSRVQRFMRRSCDPLIGLHFLFGEKIRTSLPRSSSTG